MAQNERLEEHAVNLCVAAKRTAYSSFLFIRRFSRGLLPGRHCRRDRSRHIERSHQADRIWRGNQRDMLAFLPYARSLRVRCGFAARRKQL